MRQGIAAFCKEAFAQDLPLRAASFRSAALSLANHRFHIASGKAFAETCALYDDANKRQIPLANAF